jgi:hypothetical protein
MMQSRDIMTEEVICAWKDTPVSQNGTFENKQVKCWVLALPVLALMFIFAVHFIDTPIITRSEGEKSWLDGPVLLATSASSERSPGKFPDKGRVSSIAHSESHAFAFINDKMVSEGDVVDDATVFKIHEDTVEFEKNGKRWIQKVGEYSGSIWAKST